MKCKCGKIMQVFGSLQNGFYLFCRPCNYVHPINNEDAKKYKK